ncbi:hypothetical protein [Herbiconiux flava]|uniref:Uncharacterized protein n=1 Tax=Herbiconiux flava TaxID=881268 RepID=A0A852SU88_9MICO|nr:hypothetical protein [Herbiconiux flava]NYD72293.1 hypothetical protein [Herbiconiux flava]GLK17744.1 hypothetical protein GCM10017602_22260 [Herbiconiux flava]
MTKGVEIDVAMNVRKFQAGASDVEAGFEQVADSLDDLSKHGEKAGDELADGLKDGGKKGEAALQRVEDSFRDMTRASGRASGDVRSDNERSERSFKELADTAKRETKQAGDDLARNVKRGTDKAENGFDDLKDEARQSARETAASFREVSDVGDLIQETLANAFVGFGPAGVAAGIAGAVGFGLLVEAISSGADQNEQRVQDMYDDMIQSGNDFLSTELVSQGIQNIQKNTAEYAQAQQDAADTGVSLSTVLLAMAGDTEALNAVQTVRAEKMTELQQKQQEHIATTTTEDETLAAQINTLETMGLRYDSVASSTETASAKVDIYRQAMEQAGGASEGASAKIQGVIDKVNALPPNRTIRIDVDDSALEAAITRQQGRTIQINVDGQITRIGNQVY